MLAPLNELFGRVCVLQYANLIYLVFNTPCGFAQTKNQLLAFRLLSGIGGSAPQAVGLYTHGVVPRRFSLPALQWRSGRLLAQRRRRQRSGCLRHIDIHWTSDCAYHRSSHQHKHNLALDLLVNFDLRCVSAASGFVLSLRNLPSQDPRKEGEGHSGG